MSFIAAFPSIPASKRRWSLDDMAARTIVLICGLNLNGVLTMLTGVGQTFSWALLCAAMFLVTRHASKALASYGSLFLALVGTYFAFGIVFYTPDRSFVSPISLITAYTNSVLLVLAIAGYVSGLPVNGQLRRYMSFVRTTFVISALATLLSPVLYSLYLQVPFNGAQRMGGLFGNPNEAAIVGVLAVALLFVYPVRHLWDQTALVVLCSLAVILTLSKTGISLLIIVLLLVCLSKGRFWMALLVGSLSALALIIQPDAKGLVVALVDLLGLNLSSDQMKRLLAIPEIFSGQITAATSTNRTYVWNLIMSDALDRFPQGGGIGSAHFYYGGFFENNTWQGAHNTFLMLFAEAGPIPPLLLAYILIALALRLWNAGPDHRGLLIALAVLTVEMSGSHHALSGRYSNVVLASLIGVAHTLWVARRHGSIGLQRHTGGRPVAIGPSHDSTS